MCMVLPWYTSKVSYMSRSHSFNKTLTHISLQLKLRMNGEVLPIPSAHCWLPRSYTHTYTHTQSKGYFMKRKMKSPWINQSVKCDLSPLFRFIWTQSWFRLHCLFIAGPNCVGGSGKGTFMEINRI